jgi:hypothetical protein
VTKAGGHIWEFKARFRRHAYGWRSQPAIQRVKQAVSEIKKAARTDPVLAADGSVTLLERLSPALEHVDSSSGAIGTAVNNAVAELVPIIAGAPSDPETREMWLERLWEAHGADQIPYIEKLPDFWGELCASKEAASAWADRLVGITRSALSPDKDLHGHFHGTSACLSALYHAERYEEIVDFLQVDAICEDILLSSGAIDEAYEQYGLRANRGGTYLATFRSVARKYPHRPAGQILADLVRTTPGDEGKWFAAAKEAGLYDEALALARRTPCDPKTLTRAARDFAERQPAFAVGAGLVALHWLVQGYGYDITGADVWAAYASTMKAAENSGTVTQTRERVKALVAGEPSGGLVARILGRDLEL